MNRIKVNGTHVHAVYEKIEVLSYFMFAAEGIIVFHINFSFPHARLTITQFGINF